MANSLSKVKIPAGGNAGEALTKASSADYDMQWSPVASATHLSAILGLYKVDANSVGGAPSSGYIRYNNATQINSSSITIHHLTDNGIDIDLFLEQLSAGIPFVIQDKNASESYQIWEISSAPVHSGVDYWTIPVTLNSSGGTGTTGFSNNHEVFIASFGGGVSDHGSLSGLSDDDHPQYHNDARGDARYYTQAQVNSALSGKENVGVAAGLVSAHEAALDPHSQYTTTAEAQSIADAKVDNTAYDASSWDGVTTIAPSKNAVRDKIESLSTEIAQKADLVSYSQYGGF